MTVREKTMLEFAGFCFIYRPELGSDINTLIASFLNKKKEALILPVVSGSANDFEVDLFKLVNNYAKQGLKKPDLVKKIEWILGSCKVS